jgi:hypothetical protein
MKLDEKGRCCGRKPLTYKRYRGTDYPAGYFCSRCSRCYDLVTKEQINSWAWKLIDGVWHSAELAPVTLEKRWVKGGSNQKEV